MCYFYYDFCHYCYNNIYYFVEYTVEKFENSLLFNKAVIDF